VRRVPSWVVLCTFFASDFLPSALKFNTMTRKSPTGSKKKKGKNPSEDNNGYQVVDLLARPGRVAKERNPSHSWSDSCCLQELPL
jgi:hypothetical protein